MAFTVQIPLPEAADRWLTAKRSDPAWKGQAAELLVELLRIDTTPKSDPAACASAEQGCFDVIRRVLKTLAPDAAIEFAPIRKEITSHPYFTRPYYACKGDASKAEAVETVYKGRGNLFARLGKPGRPTLIFNGHMDTVAPFLPVRTEGDIVHGRGAVDDKGPCLAFLLAATLLNDVQQRFGIEPACDLLLQFVIDEEPGGNGSLSAAFDVRTTPPSAVVVMECTGMNAYPANRGAVWFEVRLESAPGSRVNLVEAMAFVVTGLSVFGQELKAKSDHPLFPHRPVQTCHGRIGCYGQHPSRVQDYVALRLDWQDIDPKEIARKVDDAVASYCTSYGDKTKPGAGDAVLSQHIRWTDVAETHAKLEVFGLAGHMGSVDRLDGAITKASVIILNLAVVRGLGGDAWQSLKIDLAERDDANALTLEGGQGFLPTHELEQVCEGLQEAVLRAVRSYLTIMADSPDAIRATVTFEKLHNAAFARRTDGPAMTAMLEAGTETGVYHGEPIRGWDVSCDARIFAKEFPDAEIITFGPGLLAQAHGNDEQIDINDVVIAAETLARLALKYGG